jgi:hydroxylysine kinase
MSATPAATTSDEDPRAPVAADPVSAPVSSTPTGAAERWCLELYGMKVAARRLSSERDENFHLLCEDGSEYLLKITNASESRDVTDFQTQALMHVHATAPRLPVPRIVPSLDGELEVLLGDSTESRRVMRMMSFVPGELLHNAERSAAQCRGLGEMLGRLDLALRDYVHPASGHVLLWDLKHAATLRPLLSHIADADRRALATRYLDNFEAHALPLMSSLRSQVIHNDFQPSNVLVDARVPTQIVGIIDFGDMVEAALVNDVAVAASYHIATAPEPLTYVAEFVAAFHKVVPLDADEIGILFDLMAARLVMTVAITNWRAAQHPDRSAYILRNAPTAWRGLERCAVLSREQAQFILRRACGLE